MGYTARPLFMGQLILFGVLLTCVHFDKLKPSTCKTVCNIRMRCVTINLCNKSAKGLDIRIGFTLKETCLLLIGQNFKMNGGNRLQIPFQPLEWHICNLGNPAKGYFWGYEARSIDIEISPNIESLKMMGYLTQSYVIFLKNDDLAQLRRIINFMSSPDEDQNLLPLLPQIFEMVRRVSMQKISLSWRQDWLFSGGDSDFWNALATSFIYFITNFLDMLLNNRFEDLSFSANMQYMKRSKANNIGTEISPLCQSRHQIRKNFSPSWENLTMIGNFQHFCRLDFSIFWTLNMDSQFALQQY